MQEARQLNLPTVSARPWENVFERVLAVIR